MHYAIILILCTKCHMWYVKYDKSAFAIIFVLKICQKICSLKMLRLAILLFNKDAFNCSKMIKTFI